MKEEIKKKYCLEINEIIKNENSTDGNVYILISFSNKYIIKLYDDKKHVISMINIHKDLINSGMNVPDIILNKDNESYSLLKNGKYCVIYSFLNGEEIGKVFKNINETISIKIAREMKKFHNITNDNNKYNLPMIPFKVDGAFNRYSVLHFDLTKSNIFYNKKWESQIGFIDFDDAKYGPTVVDVAILISLLYFSKSRGVNTEGLNAFLNEYYDNEELKKHEMPYLKNCALKWINYIMDNTEFDSSTTESFEIRKNLIKTEIFLKDDN